MQDIEPWVWDDYFVLIPEGALVGVSLVGFLSLVRDGAPIPYQTLALLLVIALSLGFYFTFRAIKRSYALTWIETGLSTGHNRELSRLAVESIGWELAEDYKSYLAANTEVSGFTWGQEVTVIFDDGGVFVNIRNRSHALANGRSPWMFGKGARLLRRFSEELERHRGIAAA